MSAGVGALGLCEAGICLCPTVAFVTCPFICQSVHIYVVCIYKYIYMYTYTAPGWHSCSADWAVFLALAPPVSAVSFCGLLCAPRQGAGKAQLSFVSAFEVFMIHLSSQIPACKVGRAFPRGEEST